MDQPENTPLTAPDHFAPLAIKLLQGVVYEEDTQWWQDLIKVHELPLRRYFIQLGLQLVVDRNEGFAFLRQTREAQDTDMQLPRLMRRHPLTFDQSILCVLLRERLEEHTVRDTASREPIMSLRELSDMVELFFRERDTQKRFLKDLKKTVGEIKGMGFLETVDSKTTHSEDEPRYRVRRILKAFIDTDSLQSLLKNISTATV